MINKMENAIPAQIKKYFWDVKIDKLNPAEYPYFVIGRILEYGDEDAVKWMTRKFQKSVITKTLLENRNISRKSAEYWAVTLGLPKNKIRCLKEFYQKRQKVHWPH